MKRTSTAEKTSKRYSSQILLTGSQVHLSEWLDVSWFYPEGFTKEKLVETPRSLIVLGSSIVYKFIIASCSKPGSGGLTFTERWQRACQEILDNRELAPDLYLGVRLFRWIDGEPHWNTECRGNGLDSQHPPQQADDVALVLRRLPATGRLSQIIESDDAVSAVQLTGLVKTLSKFHQRRHRAGIQHFLGHAENVVNTLRINYLDRLKRAINLYGNCLDPFSQIALQETKSFLDSWYQEHKELFFRRGKSGWIVDCHGNLSSRNISFKPLLAGSRRVSVFGRMPRDNKARRADILYDVASLVVDLESKGYKHLASQFETQYFATNEGVYDEGLYNFHLVVVAAKRALELFRQSPRRNSQGLSTQARTYLSLALRYSLKLRGRFLVAVGGPLGDGSEELAQGLVKLTSAQLLTVDSVVSPLATRKDLEMCVFDKLLSSAKRCLLEETPVVIVWPLNREEERLSVAKLAESLDIPYLLVKCHLSHEERVRQGLKRLSEEPAENDKAENNKVHYRRLWLTESKPWKKGLLSQHVHQLFLEPVLPQSESAFFVLRKLVTKNKPVSTTRHNRQIAASS